MAYIRTYNTIYKISKILKNGSILIKGKFHIDKCMTDDFKIADTIEELCDEAVAVYPDGSHDNCSVMHIVDNNGFCEAVYGCLSVSADDLKKDYECWEVYGAIWTDKGLIYVAKMNKKGELVLL